MSQHVRVAPLADSAKNYESMIEDLHMKLMQERGTHELTLADVYIEALRSNQPRKVVMAIENTMGLRKQFNDQKTARDAQTWVDHNNKVKTALKSNVGVLTGGSRGIADRRNVDFERDVSYVNRRSNAYVNNLNSKIQQDRGVNMYDLKNILHIAKHSPSTKNFVSYMEDWVARQETYNTNRTKMDAKAWYKLDKKVKKNSSSAGINSDFILSAGRID